MQLSNTHRMHCSFFTQQRLRKCDTMLHYMYTAYLSILSFHFCLYLPSILFHSGLQAKFQNGKWSHKLTEKEIVICNLKISLLVVVDETNKSNY